MSHEPWSNAERESLYQTAIDHINDLEGYGEIDVNDEAIKAIRDAHEGNQRDALSIAMQLAQMNFLKQFGKKLVRIPLKSIDIHGFGAHPNYKKLKANEEKEIREIISNHWNQKTSLAELTSIVTASLPLSEHHVLWWLMKEGIALLSNPEMADDEAPNYVLAVNPDDLDKPVVKLKEIDDAVKAHINSLRANLSGLYNSRAQPNPAIVYSNDGTGTGKSYSVIDQYVAHTPAKVDGSGHRNLVFITPQKAQIKFDESTVEKARAKGIHFLGFYSQADFSELNFRNWVTQVKTEDLFQSWVDELNDVSAYAESISLLDSSVKHLKHCNSQISRLEKEDDKIGLGRIKEDQARMRYNIQRATKDMCSIALNDKQVDPNNGGNHYFRSSSKRDEVIASILDHYVPLERAKYMPCVLMGTTKKFITTTPVARLSKDGYVFAPQNFDHIVGKKVTLNHQDGVKEANGKPFGEQVKFLREDFFKIDENNYFFQKDISFTVVVDEEHIAYDQILDEEHKVLFDKNIRIAHVFAAAYRIMNRARHADPERPNGLVLEDACQKFDEEVVHLFNNKCHSNFSIDQIIRMFKDNFGDMLIDGKDVEQVVNLCKNVFSVTPKRFFNENGLKKIRIKSYAGESECRIYYDNELEGIDPNPSMHDVMQAIICVFAACARIKDQKLISFIAHNSDNSQNSLLSNFILTAQANRGSIDSLFSRIDDQNLRIDEFFTYFTPKIIFSLEKLDDIPLPPSALQNAIYVGFKMELFGELPEVSAMRMLHGTDNTLISLSATSGFHGSFSGNFARPVITKYGHGHQPENLEFSTISRSVTDIKALNDLRNARIQLRTVSINSFEDSDTGAISKSANARDRKFKDCLAVWRKELAAHMFDRNKFRVRELNRQVEALMMSAWDGKNTLTLSLSNKFSQTYREYLKSTTIPMGRFKSIRADNKIFEVKPFDNGITVRVILFDADLNKDCVIDDYMKVDQNTKIAFFSSYQTAGTGLNLFVHDEVEDIDEDFERLVLVNSPFYSKIKTPQGLNTATNHILALKHYASSSQALQIQDFDNLLRSRAVKKLLMDEHYLSILKDIMQAIGRIERRDTNTATEIYLPDSLLEDVSLQFSQISTPANNMLINSMSLLNTQLMEHCMSHMAEQSFDSDQERSDFTKSVITSSKQIEYFLGTVLRMNLLPQARKGDREAAELNELLRSIDCIENPERFVERLKSHPIVKNNKAYSKIIDGFYINLPESQRHVKICWAKGIQPGLTDFMAGSQVYRPYEMIVPEYSNLVGYEKDDASSMVVNKLWDSANKTDCRMLPNPELLALLKGNVGEHMFKTFLGYVGANPMSLDTLFNDFDPKAYEMFDQYILKDGYLLCIDVKNWGLQLEDSDLSQQLVQRAMDKRLTMIELCKEHGYTPTFVYVNTHYDRNADNKEQEFTKGSPIHYMNLFKVNDFYRLSKDKKKTTVLDAQMEFNQSLISLFK